MAKTRYRGPDRTLSLVLRLLENDDLTSARIALHTVFSGGFLVAPDFGLEGVAAEDVLAVRDLLRMHVRWLAVQPTVSLDWTLSAPVTFSYIVVKRRAVSGLRPPVTIDRRTLGDAAQLLFMLLVREVGLRAVVPCAAPDCARTFVKFHKREYCSDRCQKRVYMARRRENDRLARARRQRMRRA